MRHPCNETHDGCVDFVCPVVFELVIKLNGADISPYFDSQIFYSALKGWEQNDSKPSSPNASH